MSLHLTRAIVPYDVVSRWKKGGGFSDSYAWHKRAWDCFPGRPEAKRDFLTRVDETDGGLRLLILSSEIPVRPDWCPSMAWETKVVPENFFNHTAFQFSLLANPTRKTASPRGVDGRRRGGKRVPISRREDLLEWLERKGLQHGFKISPQTIRTVLRPRQTFVKSGKAGRHAATEFTGVLAVVDSDAFRDAFTKGIGSAKAFGFGMLCLSPLG